jgi:hypothetical protein
MQMTFYKHFAGMKPLIFIPTKDIPEPFQSGPPLPL